MCTAVTYLTKDFYFGRTLDYEHGFGEELLLTPREYPLVFRHCGLPARRYAILGMGCVVDGYPLYFDAFNEKGLAKMEIALCQGKHTYDKRQALREKDDKREVERLIKR